jgi:NAD(P)-dependent dehydrogenase (short-subunit alcohol dehydrogenase family)
MLRSVVPLMRIQRSGVMININVVAEQIGFPGSSAFVSSQFEIQGLSESLRYELEPSVSLSHLSNPGSSVPQRLQTLLSWRKEQTDRLLHILKSLGS